MLIDRYPAEDVFAHVPELAGQTDPVLRQLDPLLDDDPLFQLVRADLAQRYAHTTDHGRHATPVEVILRLLVVKRLFNWGDEEAERRVADSLVLRWFCRVYFHRVPDATTLLHWSRTIQPVTLHALLDRISVLAQQHKVTKGRKLRLDGSVVQNTIRHPTDSSLLVDGVRVLSRVLRRAKPSSSGACRRWRAGSLPSCTTPGQRLGTCRRCSRRRTHWGAVRPRCHIPLSAPGRHRSPRRNLARPFLDPNPAGQRIRAAPAGQPRRTACPLGQLLPRQALHRCQLHGYAPLPLDFERARSCRLQLWTNCSAFAMSVHAPA